MDTCSIEFCDKPSRAGGMCEPHYRRAKDYGDPLYLHEKVCVECGAAFRAFHKSARICSDECRRGRARLQERSRSRDIRGGLTCAGCAKPIHKSRTSAPQGRAKCRDCRNGGRGYYEYGDGRKASHGASAYARGCRCDVCKAGQAEVSARFNARYSAKHGHHYSSGWRRRFKAEHGFWPQGSGTEFVDAATRRAIYERDGWVCQLCEAPVDPGATAHAERASLDHIVPQSRGGSHDPSNLRMAHVGCNARRRDRVDDLEGVL